MRRRIQNVEAAGSAASRKRRRGGPPRPTVRAGFTLFEMFVAAVVFGTALVTFLPMMQSVGNQQRFTEQRLLALREAEGLLEQLASRSWSELTKDSLSSQTLSDEA